MTHIPQFPDYVLLYIPENSNILWHVTLWLDPSNVHDYRYIVQRLNVYKTSTIELVDNVYIGAVSIRGCPYM